MVARLGQRNTISRLPSFIKSMFPTIFLTASMLASRTTRQFQCRASRTGPPPVVVKVYGRHMVDVRLVRWYRSLVIPTLCTPTARGALVCLTVVLGRRSNTTLVSGTFMAATLRNWHSASSGLLQSTSHRMIRIGFTTPRSMFTLLKMQALRGKQSRLT